MAVNLTLAPALAGKRAPLAVLLCVAGVTPAVWAQESSADEQEASLGRRAAALYEVAAAPLALILETPVSPQDVQRNRQTQVASIGSPLVIEAALAQPDVASLSVFRGSTDKTGWVRDRLVVGFPGGGDVMEIAIVDPEAPEKDLLAIANAISKAYYDEVIFRKMSERALPLQVLRTSLRKLSDQVRDKLEVLRQLEADSGLSPADDIQRQLAMHEARLVGERIEELRSLRFGASLRRLGAQDEDDNDVDWQAKQKLFDTEEMRLKAQLETALATAKSPGPSVDIVLRRQEIETLQDIAKQVANRIQLLQIQNQSPSQIRAIGSKSDAWAPAVFHAH